MSDKKPTIWEKIEEFDKDEEPKDTWAWTKKPKKVGRPAKRGVRKGSEGAERGAMKRRKPTGKPKFVQLEPDAESMGYYDDKKEHFDMGDGCKLEYNHDGSIVIGKNCEGKAINSLEISIMDRIQTEIDKKHEI